MKRGEVDRMGLHSLLVLGILGIKGWMGITRCSSLAKIPILF